MLACVRLPEIQSLQVPVASEAKVGLDGGQGAPEGPAPVPAKVSQKELRRLEEVATGRPLIGGNHVKLLFDGPQTMAAMMASIRAARSSINLETYIFAQDELGLKFADLLIAKQKEGVQVNIIYDCVGTAGTPEAFFTRMLDAGIQLCPFHPLNPLMRLGRWKVNHRDHRKILVVDGIVGFAGGANISGTYLFGSLFRHKDKTGNRLGWRDTHLQIEGPAVASLQALFVENWFSQTEFRLDPKIYFPAEKVLGDTKVRVVGSEPGGDFEIYRAYILAIEQATRTIHLTAAYFVPDPQLLKALERAARRGVAVEIILTTITDSSVVQHASQSFYQELLQAGVHLYQLKSSILHAKTAVVDAVWSTVGSTNLDMRSFLFNKEVNVIVVSSSFGTEMENAFQEDRKNSLEVTAGVWGQRPRSDRVKEWAARVMAYWL
jgi:cardiolipin synthase